WRGIAVEADDLLGGQADATSDLLGRRRVVRLDRPGQSSHRDDPTRRAVCEPDEGEEDERSGGAGRDAPDPARERAHLRRLAAARLEAMTARHAAPQRAGLVLGSLILVAGVANLNLSVANVALPSIGKHFDSSQTTLNLIAVGYSLGLAASVLYLGAVGDRYGRKLLLVLGVALSVPACLLAAWAPSASVLVVARIFGGISAGMAFPTTLALITALWSGPARTKSIALWSALGGAISALGPLLAGLLLEHYW